MCRCLRVLLVPVFVPVLSTQTWIEASRSHPILGLYSQSRWRIIEKARGDMQMDNRKIET